MAICPPKKIDSNITGLRYALERCLAELPANPIWRPLEPNSYSDFGGQISTIARNPINPSRSRKKGVVTGLEASGGFNQDITQSNTTDLLQGFLFADARERGTTASLVHGQSIISNVDGTLNVYEFNNVAAVSATVSAAGSGYRIGDLLAYATDAQRAARFYVLSVDATGGITAVAVDDAGLRGDEPTGALAVTGGSGTAATLTVTWGEAMPEFVPGELVLASGFSTAANNGIKTVATYADGVITMVEELVDETPTDAAKVQTVGHRFDAGDVSIALNGSLARLTSALDVDFGDFGFEPGDWIYLDGFANNGGFARIGAIDAAGAYLELDKTDWTPVAEAAGTIVASIYFGTVIKNESDPALIVRRSYQIERTLGQDTDGTMSEYLVGAVPNEFTLNVAQEDKATVDMTFVATDNEARSGAEGLKGGTRPRMLVEDAFNTSSDFSRIKLSTVDPLTSNPQALFAFATDLTLTINNNVSANKAIGILGAFDATAGTFEVGGSLTAYFASIDAVKAVRNNADITMDFIMVKNNAGLLFDVPLLALGNGRLNVERDQSITLPLDTSAAESSFGHTLLIQSFPYLPNSAG